MKRIELTISKLSFAALLLTAGLLATTGCKKNEIDGPGGPVADKITVTIDKVTPATTSATFTGKVEKEADAPKDATYGVEYSLNASFAAETVTQQTVTLDKDGSFSLTVDHLFLASTYNYRSFVSKGKDDVEYGKAATFNTGDVTVTVAETTATETTATLKGTVSEQPEGVVFGLIYSTTTDPETDENKATAAILPAKDGSFTVSLEGLTAGQTYNYKTYTFQNELVYRYGAVANFSTNALPTADKITVNEVKPADGTPGKIVFTGSSSGILESLGAVLSFQYSTSADFAEASTVSQAINANASFEITNNSLKPATTYYYRASMTVSEKTTYTAVKNFTTKEVTVSLGDKPQTFNETSAKFMPSLDYTMWDLSDTELGLLYSTDSACTLDSPDHGTALIVDDEYMPGMGFYQSNLSGLTAGTTYYVRTYIKRGGNYSLGDKIVTFTTKSAEPTAALITVNEVKPTSGKIVFTGSSSNIAESFGAVLSFQYSTSADFAEASTVTESINVNASFEVTKDDLKPATTYYYRATMTVSGKTTYTDAKNFTTKEVTITLGDKPQTFNETSAKFMPS
ncbi:MAG: hypothetical protein ACI395_06140, partial [Candidatus Cryptobacteroides sp.]